MADPRWVKMQIGGVRVYRAVTKTPGHMYIAMRTNLVPVGIVFRAHGKGWAVIHMQRNPPRVMGEADACS